MAMGMRKELPDDLQTGEPWRLEVGGGVREPA